MQLQLTVIDGFRFENIFGACLCYLLRYAGVIWLIFSCSRSSADQIYVEIMCH